MVYRYRMRVPFGDADHAGLVYYPHIFHYFHLAYEDFFHEILEMPYQDFFELRCVGAPIVHSEAEFLRPLRHGDEIEVHAQVLRMGTKSWTWRFSIFREGDAENEPRVVGTITKVFVHMATMKSQPLEEDVRAKVEAWLAQGT
ncbi:MAG: acyl-CoA thioesterase [Candidatus Eisenbacteria bacterium]|uniref:Acyl-CoA thioesterase n=1 Tax=Eiseniibacteriota bacterium TaxID=2212470 RepID=A0A7Y2EB10_UNCEI|nr:acyl-CoA thioesterase [Candidatus Eisenbacteria bacterium]